MRWSPCETIHPRIAIIDGGFEDLHTLASDPGAAEPANEFFALPENIGPQHDSILRCGR